MAVQEIVDFSKITSQSEDHSREWRYGMDHARVEFDNGRLKAEFIRWAQDNGVDGIDHLETLPDWRYMTIGRMAWLMNNGAEITPGASEVFLRALQELRGAKGAVQDTTTDDDLPITSKVRQIQMYVNLYSRIDALRKNHADDQEALEQGMLKTFQGASPGMPMLRKLYQHYRELLTESITGRHNPLVEATIEPLVTVVNVLAGSTGNAKAAAELRKKVGAKAAKAASRAESKAVDKDTNLTGLIPALLIGNSAALLYNAKNRKAMVYVAKEGETLGVKGTYITGYDEELSFGKTLRKPKETFDKILHNANAKRIRHVLDTYIKGKHHDVNGKLNKDTMIIKVFK